MPTTRTPIRRGRSGKFTPEVIELYRQLREIHDADDADLWAESYELRLKLKQLLNRREPWLNDIFWTIGGDEQCVHSPDSAAHDDWPTALAIRQALDEAIGYQP